MKKVLSVFLCLLIVFAFAGCGKNSAENAPSADASAILTNASAGIVPEATYKIGTEVNELKTAAEAANPFASTGDGVYTEGGMFFSEGETENSYVDGPVTYGYKKDKESAGVSAVICFDTAYGLAVGMATEYDIRAALPGIIPTEKTAVDADLYFMMFGIDDCKMLSYNAGDNVLSFYFSADTLIAVTLMNPANR